MTLSEPEQKMIHWLAGRFERNDRRLRKDRAAQELEMDEGECEVIIRRMDAIGAVEELQPTSTTMWFVPTSYAVDLSREIKEHREEKPDFVDQIQRRVNQNPFLATIIIVFLILSFAAPLYPVVVDLLERFGYLNPLK